MEVGFRVAVDDVLGVSVVVVEGTVRCGEFWGVSKIDGVGVFA